MANDSALIGLSHENVWCEQSQHEDAELHYQQYLVQQKCGRTSGSCSSNLMAGCTDSASNDRISCLGDENKDLLQVVKKLEEAVKRLEARVSVLEKGCTSTSAPISGQVSGTVCNKLVNGGEKDDEDDFELFGDDNEEDDAESERLKQERVKAYEDKKAKKPVLIAKSNIILDVKPWDDETDMVELEKCVRSIEMDGLLWGSSKLVPLAYTIKKLQISCVVEDDKVSVDDLEEKITAFEDYVQSIDIAAFNKI